MIGSLQYFYGSNDLIYDNDLGSLQYFYGSNDLIYDNDLIHDCAIAFSLFPKKRQLI